MLPTSIKGRIYQKAFWLMAKKLCLVDFIDALNMLRKCCDDEEIYACDTQEIINETLNEYLKETE